MISEEQESNTSSPQSASADVNVEDSQFDETLNDNPEKTSDTKRSAHSGKDFETNYFKRCPTYASQVGNAQIVSKTSIFDRSSVPLPDQTANREQLSRSYPFTCYERTTPI